ncbi:transposase [Streptomyces sp. NPDC004362]|uniref:transposase n=1 Tax=Streptomyces sp. NPDC004362 TaxID=3154456 RepID=UPI0033B69DA8
MKAERQPVLAGRHSGLAPSRSRPMRPGGLLAVAGIVEQLGADEVRERFHRVVSEVSARSQGGGMPRHGDRAVLAAIVFAAAPGCTWQQLPVASFESSGAAAHRRFTDGTGGGVWADLHRLVLDDSAVRGLASAPQCAMSLRLVRSALPTFRSRAR